MLAGDQRVVLWQLSQAILLVGMWLTGLPGARAPGPAWQVAQSRGVPRKLPEVWQDSHCTCLCVVSRMKPVVS